MKFSKPVKILIGAVTLAGVIFPFLIGPLFVFFLMFVAPGFPFYSPSIGNSSEYMTRFMPIFFLVFFPSMMCFSLLQLVLKMFYLALIITDKRLTDVTRVLFALTVFFMPFIAMPLYFVVYFWKDSSQEAITPSASPLAPV
jgi:hypothetical protein